MSSVTAETSLAIALQFGLGSDAVADDDDDDDAGTNHTQEIPTERDETQRLLAKVHDENKTNVEQPTVEAHATANSNSQNQPLSINKHKICEKIESNFLSSAFGSVTTIKSVGKKQTINARTVLWYLAFVGFAVNYMFRININIAIVEMVATKKAGVSGSVQVSECFAMPNVVRYNETNATNFIESKEKNMSFFADTNNQSIAIVLGNKSDDNVVPQLARNRFSIVKPIFNLFGIAFDDMGAQWNEVEQSRVLGAFFSMHWLLQIPGGLLAQRYGTKLIFGLSNLVGCLLCILLPFAAHLHVNYLIAIRVLQGLISALSWPAMHHLTAQWIPPDERSQFVTSYLGSSVGIAVFYPFFGFIMSIFSWEWVFYFTGMFGSCWYIGWWYFVYDSPAQHPRIDPLERHYIEKSLGGSLNNDEKRKTPWAKIIRSRAVWVNIIGQWGGIWALFTMMTQAPTYFRIIHGWNLQMTGLLSGVPHLMRMVFAFCFSNFADSLLRNKRMSRTNVRKLAGSLSTLVNGIFIMGLAYSGCSSLAAVVFFTLATAVHGAVSSGPLASVIDISPNYSGVILGLNGLVGVWPGFISPYIVGKLTLGNQTIQQWQYVFFISAGLLFVCGLVYVLFADSTIQSWNQPEQSDEISQTKKNQSRSVSIGNVFYLPPKNDDGNCRTLEMHDMEPTKMKTNSE